MKTRMKYETWSGEYNRDGEMQQGGQRQNKNSVVLFPHHEIGR